MDDAGGGSPPGGGPAGVATSASSSGSFPVAPDPLPLHDSIEFENKGKTAATKARAGRASLKLAEYRDKKRKENEQSLKQAAHFVSRPPYTPCLPLQKIQNSFYFIHRGRSNGFRTAGWGRRRKVVAGRSTGEIAGKWPTK